MPIACSRFIWNIVHFAALRPSLGGFGRRPHATAARAPVGAVSRKAISASGPKGFASKPITLKRCGLASSPEPIHGS